MIAVANNTRPIERGYVQRRRSAAWYAAAQIRKPTRQSARTFRCTVSGTGRQLGSSMARICTSNCTLHRAGQRGARGQHRRVQQRRPATRISASDSKINRLATHSADPNLDAGCPNPGEETPNFKTDFKPGDAIIFAAYYHDQLAGQVTNFRVLRPDATLFAAWNKSFAGPPSFYAASYWFHSTTLPADAPAGIWTFEATFQGVVTTKTFTINDIILVDGFGQVPL